MTFKLVESPMGSKDIVLKKCWIFAPSDGPKSLFQYLFLTIIDNIYKTVSSILLLRKVSNPDNFGTVAGISYISFILKDSKKKKRKNEGNEENRPSTGQERSTKYVASRTSLHW